MPNKAKLALTVILLAGAGAFLMAQPSSGPEGRDGAPRPPRGPRGDGNRPRPLVTEQQEADFLRALEDKRPEVAKILKRLKDENPREYRFALAEAYRNWLYWKDTPPEVQKSHETQVRVKVDAWRASRDYLAATDPEQKERLRARLLELLGQEFDADQTIREYRLNQLAEQLARLRNELKERAEKRTQVIDQSLQSLLASRARPKVDGEPRRPFEGRPRTMPASRPAE